MTEDEFYQCKVKPILQKAGVFYTRIDLPTVPDIYVSFNGRVMWIEMKVVNKKMSLIKPDWQPGQLAFFKKHEIMGGGVLCVALNYFGETYFLPTKEFYKKEELICQKTAFFRKLMNP